ncbi:MAG: hypothetical protein ACRC51_00440 [Cetobacterium sp.]
MKTALTLILQCVRDMFKSKQSSINTNGEIKLEKVKKYSKVISFAFFLLISVCVFGYFHFPYTFGSDSWPVKFLFEIFEYIKNN